MTMTRSRPLPLLDDVAPPSRYDSQSEHDAGFGALETSRGRLPLAAMDVTGRIDGLLSHVTVRQTFVNATGEPLEATYIFPLPDRGAVTDFRMEVAGRVVEGVLEERGQARREYSQALRQGHRASIAEEERPGVFTLRVGNLMPGDVASIELTMVGVLPYSDGEVTFRFPLVVAPRYIPGIPLSGASVGDGTAVDTNAVPDASRISPPVLLPGFPNPVRLSLAIDLYESAAPADDLRVSLFTVWGEERGGMRRLILQPGERLDRDFILRFRLGGDSVRTSLSLHPDTGESGEGTFALTVVPPLLGEAMSRPRDVVFVLDRSGSMAGWKMVAARRAMARMIDTLNESDRFTVFAFDDRIETPQWGGQDGLSQLIAASDHDRFKAVEFLAKLESRGGTEIAQPLDQAVGLLAEAGAKRDHDRDRIIFLVTDGQVGNEDQVLKVLGVRLEGIRVFTLGIDQAVNEGFLRRLAELGQGGGSCELVESEQRLDAVMDSVHRRIGTPVVTDVRLEPAAGGFEVVADTQVPDRLPCLFAGSPLLLLGRYRGRPHGPVEVRGNTPGGTAWHEALVPNFRDNPAIASAWARGQVRQLEDRYAAGQCDRSVLEQTIIATSLRFGVLCRFTAYVAVDRSAVVNEGGEVHKITQPVEMPAGWGEDATTTGYVGFCAPESAMHPDVCLWTMTGSSASPPSTFRGLALRDLMSKPDMSPPSQSAPSAARLSRRPSPTSPTPPPSTPEDLLRQEGFTLLEEIGQDEHGTLYNGRDQRGRLVSVRVLKNPVNVAGSAAFAKLQKELKGLKHPAIVPILRLIGDARSGLVIAIVSEYVAGPSLTRWISQSGLPDPREAVRLVLVLAEALEYGGRQNMIHGNLMADNIWIADDGKPRITGFGLARLDCRPAVSTERDRAFVAPELLAGSPAQPTAQTDIYSLGAVFYRLLTGVLPDRDQGSRHPRPPRAINPQVPADLETLCLKAMNADPAARYASAGELAGDLRKVLGVKRPGLLGRIIGTSKPKPRTPPPGAEGREDFWK
ncbi:MAG: VIT domain-containing protein [Isosphaerales bacterium]